MVTIVAGKSGINTLLTASQVVLSVVLPFAAVPLVYCTSSKTIMGVRKPRFRPPSVPMGLSDSPSVLSPMLVTNATAETVESASQDEMVDFSSGKVMTMIGGGTCLVIIAANMYVIVDLALGQGG